MTPAVGVVGSGAWGTALAQTVASLDLPVVLWCRRPEVAEAITRTRHNPEHLPDHALDATVTATTEMNDLGGCRVVLLAVPTHALRTIAGRLPELSPETTVVSAAKGFELASHLTMSAVLRDVLPPVTPVAVLSGPNIAAELMEGHPAASVVASADESTAIAVRDLLSGPRLRLYSSTDVVGVEFGGALKNVVAIAAGVCDGIGAGDNAKAAIIARGLAEVARIGIRAGAAPLTFAGLAGLGDCIATCMSRRSRNRSLGEALARGLSLEEATADGQAFEGVNATSVALDLAIELHVDMPIATAVSRLLFEGSSVDDAVAELMSRDPADELRGLALDRLD